MLLTSSDDRYILLTVKDGNNKHGSETMKDREIIQWVNEWNARYDDEHTTTDPHSWTCHLTITYYGEDREFRGTGETRGEARKEARSVAASRI